MKKENAGKDINNSLYPIIPDDELLEIFDRLRFSLNSCISISLLGCFLREISKSRIAIIHFENNYLKFFKARLSLKSLWFFWNDDKYFVLT